MAEKAEANGQASGKLTKAEAVTRSLEALGGDPSPKAVAADVKGRFGIDVRPKYASRIKSELAGGQAQKPAGKKAGRKRRRSSPTATAVTATPSAPAAQAAPTGGHGASIRLEDLQAVKELVRRVGATQLRALIGLFER